MPNKLVHETSLYLRQHADQPVDWYPWGDDAFRKAQCENKIIFLSIGYSACHWCHVMAHECFANAEIAEFLNQHFVSVKVDREERPDVDAVYMNVCMALNGSGGWPLTVFLTPELHPIFAGTYFPPYDRAGRRGFFPLLKQIHTLWQRDSHALREQANVMTSQLSRLLVQEIPQPTISTARHETLFQAALQHFDERYGGFGRAPKFPPDSILSALLIIGVRHNNPHALSMVAPTLDAMAYGGLFDQLAGGFARYCVDDDWTIPHFEKMLYTQALLARLYSDAAVVFGNEDYLRIACETADWVLAKMQTPEGRFYASFDADSDGQEGRYYVWSREEIAEALGAERASFAYEFFQVPSYGNFEGEWSVLRRVPNVTHLSSKFGLSEKELKVRVAEIRNQLLEHREHRIPPSCDEKSVLSWNALMISALVRLAEVTRAFHYLSSAEKAAQFLWRALRPKRGVLLRTLSGGKARIDAVLEDYAFFAQSLLDLYELTLSERYLLQAKELALESFEKFVDNSGAIFTTPANTPDLIFRLEDNHDSALPSAAAALLKSVIRLNFMSSDPGGFRQLEAAFSRLNKVVYATPLAAATAFLTLELRDDPVVCEIHNGDQNGRDILQPALAKSFIVNRIIRKGKEKTPASRAGEPFLLVCAGQQCYAPITNLSELKSLLERESLGVISTMQIGSEASE